MQDLQKTLRSLVRKNDELKMQVGGQALPLHPRPHRTALPPKASCALTRQGHTL